MQRTFLGDNLVTRESKKQEKVAWSNAEPEHKTMAHCICKLPWAKSLVTDLSSDSQFPMKIYGELREHMKIGNLNSCLEF